MPKAGQDRKVLEGVSFDVIWDNGSGLQQDLWEGWRGGLFEEGFDPQVTVQGPDPCSDSSWATCGEV